MKNKSVSFILLLTLFLFASPSFAGNDIAAIAKIDFPVGVEENNDVNANLAAQLVNGNVLQPGDTFLFNNAVGPRTADRDFVYGLDAGNNPDDLGSGHHLWVVFAKQVDEGPVEISVAGQVGGHSPPICLANRPHLPVGAGRTPEKATKMASY